MAEISIYCRENGPYVIEGKAVFTDSEGNSTTSEKEKAKVKVALCRCGGSATKPFCDGTHRTNGFQAVTGHVVITPKE